MAAESVFREAEVAMDEVAMLEEKLRHARARRGAAGTPGVEMATEIRHDLAVDPRSAYSFDTAVAIYGVQLRAWIDMQVDARIQQTLASMVEGELFSSRQESSTALAKSGQLEREVRSSTDAQAKLLVVVEGISEELGRLKAAMHACQLGAQLNAVRNAPSWDEMRIARHEKELDDLRVNVQRLQEEVPRIHQRCNAELAEAMGILASKRELNELYQTVHQLEAKLPAEVRSLKKELTDLRDEMTAAFQREAAAVVALDEQVWLTDQRLGQRIDELMQIHMRERDTIVVREPAPVVREVVAKEVVPVPETIHIRPKVTEHVTVSSGVIDHGVVHKEPVHIHPRVVGRGSAHLETHVSESAHLEPRAAVHVRAGEMANVAEFADHHHHLHGGVVKDAIHIHPKIGQSSVTHIETREVVENDVGITGGGHAHLHVGGRSGSAAEVIASDSRVHRHDLATAAESHHGMHGAPVAW